MAPRTLGGADRGSGQSCQLAKISLRRQVSGILHSAVIAPPGNITEDGNNQISHKQQGRQIELALDKNYHRSAVDNHPIIPVFQHLARYHISSDNAGPGGEGIDKGPGSLGMTAEQYS